jgi:hypothetical protein
MVVRRRPGNRISREHRGVFARYRVISGGRATSAWRMAANGLAAVISKGGARNQREAGWRMGVSVMKNMK